MATRGCADGAAPADRTGRTPSARRRPRRRAPSPRRPTPARWRSLTADRRPVGLVRHLRPARRRAGAVRVEPGRARPQSRRRPAGQHRDRRAEHRDRPAGQRSRSPWPGSRRDARRVTNWPPPARRTCRRCAAAKYYIDYSDFSLWVLRVQRVRWVGGYGRMDSTSGRTTPRPQPDPGRAARRRARSRTSTPTTPTRWRRWPERSAATRTPPRRSAPAPTATASICG